MGGSGSILERPTVRGRIGREQDKHGDGEHQACPAEDEEGGPPICLLSQPPEECVAQPNEQPGDHQYSERRGRGGQQRRRTENP